MIGSPCRHAYEPDVPVNFEAFCAPGVLTNGRRRRATADWHRSARRVGATRRPASPLQSPFARSPGLANGPPSHDATMSSLTPAALLSLALGSLYAALNQENGARTLLFILMACFVLSAVISVQEVRTLALKLNVKRMQRFTAKLPPGWNFGFSAEQSTASPVLLYAVTMHGAPLYLPFECTVRAIPGLLSVARYSKRADNQQSTKDAQFYYPQQFEPRPDSLQPGFYIITWKSAGSTVACLSFRIAGDGSIKPRQDRALTRPEIGSAMAASVMPFSRRLRMVRWWRRITKRFRRLPRSR